MRQLSASSKGDQRVVLVPSSMLATVSAVSAQNIGAGRMERATKTRRYATAITVVYGIVISIVVELTAGSIVGLFTTDATVILLGTQYICSYIVDSIFAGIHFCFSGFFAACGRSYIGFIHNIVAITWSVCPGRIWHQAVPEHLVPHGRRRARRIAAFRADLSWLLRVAQASRRNFGEGACMTASERSGGRDALPGDGRLFRIGKVADMFNVSLGTLRHYERCGLLEPEYIDPRTGYRYYGAKQFEVLNTIRYLRVLDMPLTQIAEFLHNRDVHVIEDKLVAQKALIERKQHELEMVQRKIDHRLERLRDAEQSEFDVIRVVRQPACRIVWIRDSPKVDSYLGTEYSIRKLEQHQKDSLVFLGKVGVGIDKESLEQGGYADYGLVFLLLDDEDEYEGDTVALPETDCVRIRFRGVMAMPPTGIAS